MKKYWIPALVTLLIILAAGAMYFMVQRHEVQQSTAQQTSTSPKIITQSGSNTSVQPETGQGKWTLFSRLPASAVGTQIYSVPGHSITFTYDGKAPVFPDRGGAPNATISGTLLSPGDSRYPDANTIKLTSFFHSNDGELLPPHDADFSTLMVNQNSSIYLKDKNHVYVADCAAGGCDYSVLDGADSATFEFVSQPRVDAKDKNHSYYLGEIVSSN